MSQRSLKINYLLKAWETISIKKLKISGESTLKIPPSQNVWTSLASQPSLMWEKRAYRARVPMHRTVRANQI